MHSHRVLVVDDDAAIRELLSDMLAADGHTAFGAADGFDALSQLADGVQPCVMLLDLLMPHMTGWELVHRLVASDDLRRIPYLVISAERLSRDGEHALDGRQRFEKPLDVGRLMTAIDQSCLASDDITPLPQAARNGPRAR